MRAWRDHQWRRARVAAALGERYPALYAWWSALQQAEQDIVGVGRGGEVLLATARSVAGLARAAGVEPMRLAVYAAAFDQLVEDLVGHILVSQDLAALQAREQSARLVGPRVRGPRRRGVSVGMVVETTGGAASRDGQTALELNVWDVDQFRDIFFDSAPPRVL